MAKQTCFGHGSREIWIRPSLVSGSQTVGMASLIVSDGRLEQMTCYVEQVARGVIAGTDHVIDAVAGLVPTALQSLPIARRRRIHRDPCFGSFDCAVRLLARTTQRVCHRGARVALDFRSMTKLAAARSSGFPHELGCGNFRIGGRRGLAAGLSSPRGNKAQPSEQNNEQQQRGGFPIPDSASIDRLRATGVVSPTPQMPDPRQGRLFIFGDSHWRELAE
jgi:hypothetical protein